MTKQVHEDEVQKLNQPNDAEPGPLHKALAQHMKLGKLTQYELD